MIRHVTSSGAQTSAAARFAHQFGVHRRRPTAENVHRRMVAECRLDDIERAHHFLPA